MKLGWGPAEDAFRADLEAFLDQHAPPEATLPRPVIGSDDPAELIPRWAREWQATLFDHGWMIPSYPPELGGRNATPTQTLIYLEVLAAREIPRSVHFPGYAIVAPSLLEFGTDDQKALAPAAIRGDTVWCIGMSEPGAGSDIASLQTRAVLDGDTFVVNGQKVWTSYSMVAQKCFLYVRTDPQAPKHEGISVLILDMDTSGIEIRPLRHLNRSAEFAEVFFTDVVVPRANLVGRLHDGWRVTMGSLSHERGGLWVQGVAEVERQVSALVELAGRTGQRDDAVVRRRVAESFQRAQTLRALGYKGFASFAQGSSAAEHSFIKLAASELTKELWELGMQLQGPYSSVADPAYGYDAGKWSIEFLESLAGTIAGGTSEVQRNIIAGRILGLPRE